MKTNILDTLTNQGKFEKYLPTKGFHSIEYEMRLIMHSESFPKSVDGVERKSPYNS